MEDNVRSTPSRVYNRSVFKKSVWSLFCLMLGGSIAGLLLLNYGGSVNAEVQQPSTQEAPPDPATIAKARQETEAFALNYKQHILFYREDAPPTISYKNLASTDLPVPSDSPADIPRRAGESTRQLTSDSGGEILITFDSPRLFLTTNSKSEIFMDMREDRPASRMHPLVIVSNNVEHRPDLRRSAEGTARWEVSGRSVIMDEARLTIKIPIKRGTISERVNSNAADLSLRTAPEATYINQAE